MKRFLVILLSLSSISVFAQLDTLKAWRFGVSSFVNFNNQVGNLNTKASIGIGLGGFARFEVDECHHYQIELNYSSAGFLFVPPGFESNSAIYRRKFSLTLERGVDIHSFIRLQYGVNWNFFSRTESPFEEFMNLRRMDIGANLALFYYSTEQISLGLRYNQGFINIDGSKQEGQSFKSLNNSIQAVMNIRLF